MSNYFGYVSVDALMDFAHNHVNGMIDSNDIARFPKANVKDANEQQSLQEIFGIPFARLRELAEAERKGKIKIGSDWTPCADGQNLPENKKEVLLSCVGHNKREYVCKGYYIRKHTEEIGAADDIEADWDEVTDTNFLPEGFYECIENWGDYSFVYINDAVLAWQPLPAPYNPDRKEDAK